MQNKTKAICLRIRRGFLWVKRNIELLISKGILLISVIILLVALCSNATCRIPIVSFVSDSICFPHKYELNGVVRMIKDDEPMMIPIEISVGGFSKKIFTNDEFVLEFVANEAENIPVVFTYLYENTEYTRIERLSFKSDYSLTFSFCFRAGE